MKKTRLVLAALILTAAAWIVAAPAQAAAKKTAAVNIHNNSKYDIHHLYMNVSTSDDWGPDQLGDKTLVAGGSFKLHSIPCETYDIKLVDEDGDECEVREVDVCGGTEEWTINNKDLMACEGFK